MSQKHFLGVTILDSLKKKIYVRSWTWIFIFTFLFQGITLPVAKAETGTNLALGKPSYASTEFQASELSNDGLLNTAWSSTFSEPAWIYIDLGSSQAIQQVVIYWERAFGQEYKIEGSNDASNWTLLSHVVHGDGGADYLSVSGTWRYVRMSGIVRGTGWGFSILEFQIYDIAQPVPPSEPYIPSLPPKPVSQMIFSDDFSSGSTSKWHIERGTWQVISGSLYSSYPCSGGDAYVVTAGDQTWKNYQLQLDLFRVGGYDPGGILIRNSSNGYYLVDVAPSLPYGGHIRLSKTNVGEVAIRSWPFNSETWNTLIIDVDGPYIDIYVINNYQKAELLISYKDTSSPFLTGGIGFYMWAGAVCPSQVKFDNIVVKQIRPSYLASGKVTNSSGDPIARVKISTVGSTISTITKLDGSFTLGRFVQGSYTVKPSKTGLTFSPVNKSISVGPSITNLIFVGSQPEIPAAPILVSPADNAVINDETPTLSWKAVQYGYKYQVQISKTDTFSTFEQNKVLDPGALKMTSSIPLSGENFWRVRAINSVNATGAWSIVRSFTIDTSLISPPKLTSPADGAVVFSVPKYTWQSVSGAAFYQLQYATSDDFKTGLYTSPKLSVLYYKPSAQSAGTYYWRVRAQNAGGSWSNWSEVRKLIKKKPVPTQ